MNSTCVTCSVDRSSNSSHVSWEWKSFTKTITSLCWYFKFNIKIVIINHPNTQTIFFTNRWTQQHITTVSKTWIPMTSLNETVCLEIPRESPTCKSVFFQNTFFPSAIIYIRNCWSIVIKFYWFCVNILINNINIFCIICHERKVTINDTTTMVVINCCSFLEPFIIYIFVNSYNCIFQIISNRLN